MSGIDNYFKAGKASVPVWADEGETVAFLKSDGGVPGVWTAKVREGAALKLSDNTEAILNMRSFPEDGVILYTMDAGGNENEQLYWLDVQSKKSASLTREPDVRHYLGGLRRGTKKVVYAANKRCPDHFDICELDTETNTERIVIQNTDALNIPAALSPCGEYLLYNKQMGKNNNALWLCELSTSNAYRVPGDEVISAETCPAWKSDSSGFYVISDRGTDFTHVAYYDMAGRSLEKKFAYDWDVTHIALSNDDRYLAVVLNTDGFSQLKIIDCTVGRKISFNKPPEGVIPDREAISWSKKGHKLVFPFGSSTCVTGIRVLDVDRDSIATLTQGSIGGMDADALVAPRLGRFSSFDGLKVPYWLYVPKGREEKSLPVVIDIHGGPEDQTRPVYSDYTQYFLSCGIAVVAPNVRGSTGYGKAYMHLDDVQMRLDSVKDVIALIGHLTDAGIADEKRIAVFGISYGGFMSLSCAARYPDLFACAVDFVGMYNLETFLENTAGYRRAWRESEYGTLARHRALLREVSPIAKVNDIKAPLMVVHGANDPRVPVEETERVVHALAQRGLTVEYLRYEDEGHGILKLKNRLDCYLKVAAFLKRHLNIS